MDTAVRQQMHKPEHIQDVHTTFIPTQDEETTQILVPNADDDAPIHLQSRNSVIPICQFAPKEEYSAPEEEGKHSPPTMTPIEWKKETIKKKKKKAHRRIYMSMHSILHSRLPRRLLNHSMPKPVHSALREAISSAAALATALA
ncbi:hypothetical protein L249_3097, partial [Ophiocordyceps polyrhachis-furcata BCC 54312]